MGRNSRFKNINTTPPIKSEVPPEEKPVEESESVVSETQLFKKIKSIQLPEDQYVKTETIKTQIILHHTVSPGNNSMADIKYWLSTKERIATHVIIQQDGTIYQCFNSKYWASHLGVEKEVFLTMKVENLNSLLDKHSLSVELDSLGPVDENGKSLAYPTSNFVAKEIATYENPFRGYNHYEEYTQEQIDSLEMLLRYWGQKFNIPLTYDPRMWDICKDALRGVPGIWAHVSYRRDKSDCHPSERLIKMLQSLDKK